MTKKARLIKRQETLTAKEKETVIDFFSKYPTYENRIDWNSKTLKYGDFETVFSLANNSRRSIKKQSKSDPEVLLKGYNYRIVSKTKDFIIIMPLDWECAVFFCSFGCGGTGAKWCIGDKNTSKHWDFYRKYYNVFYFIYFTEGHPCYGKKLAIRYSKKHDCISINNEEDRLLLKKGIPTKKLLLLDILKKNKAYTIRKSRNKDYYMFHTGSFSIRYELLEQYYFLYYFAGEAKKYFFTDIYKDIKLPEEEADFMKINTLINGLLINDIVYLKKDYKMSKICLILGIKRIYEDTLLMETIYRHAVSQNGRALEFVPELLKTESLCLKAVRRNGKALQFVPKSFKTEAICIEAVRKNGCALKFVPKLFKTETMCLDAIRLDGRALQFVPELFKSEVMCLIAVKKNSKALKYVQESFMTEAMCLMAVKKNGRTLKFVPKLFKTEAICLEAVRKNGRVLEYVPESFKTETMCLEAVGKNGCALEYVPESFKTETLCFPLFDLPEYLIAKEICLKAIRQNGWALEYVPESLKTEEMCLEAVKENYFALDYVPESLKTEEMCLEAVRQNGWALKYVPESLKTEEMCLEAVRQNGWALDYVPESLKTEEMCLEAVRQDGLALKYVPKPKRVTVYDPELPIDYVLNHFLLLNCQYGFKGSEVLSAVDDLYSYLDEKLKTGDLDNITKCEKLDGLDKKLEKLKIHFGALP
jgi:hypothetical protein